MDEESLMRHIAAGNERAFERLARLYEGRLTRFATRLTGDAEIASEAVLDALMHLWRFRKNYKQYRACGGFQSYLYRITRNACLDLMANDHLHGLSDARVADPSAPSPERVVCAGAFEDAVREAILGLPPEQREVFVLSHYEGFTYGEIAGVTGSPVGTVASRKRLAVETLRRKLAAWGNEQ